ncbi:MAG: toprim domain-containing protein [Beijerinckiaceae bacterium]
MAERVDLQKLIDDLNRSAESAAQELLPLGKRTGAEWYVSGTKSPVGYAISVCIKGNKQGIVGLFGGPKPGTNIFGLIRIIKGYTTPEAVEWGLAFLGRGRADYVAPDGRPVVQQRAPKQDRKAERRRQTAREIWRAALPIIGTEGEAYLRKRGILCPIPATLRYVPALEYTPLGEWIEKDKRWIPGPSFPAIVCQVVNLKREIISIWQIYLDGNGNKAPVENVKIGRGSMQGGALRLGPVAEEIGVVEGCETGLGLMTLTQCAFPVWCGLSTAGLQNMELPPEVKTVRIFADGDLPFRNKVNQKLMPSPGRYAGGKAGQKWESEGRRVIYEPTPLGFDTLDLATGIEIAE